MSDKRKNGGPAFPQPDLSGYGMGPVEGQNGQYQMEGMSLRDWFAATMPIRESDPSISFATDVMSSAPPSPDWGDAPEDVERWWAMAEAKLRYMRADAMIAAREGKE
jgi:hypothetical protein